MQRLCGPTAINPIIIRVLGLQKLLQMYRQHEVITSKGVLSSLSGGKTAGNGERKSNNPA